MISQSLVVARSLHEKIRLYYAQKEGVEMNIVSTALRLKKADMEGLK